jgi:hypothetical protein
VGCEAPGRRDAGHPSPVGEGEVETGTSPGENAGAFSFRLRGGVPAMNR